MPGLYIAYNCAFDATTGVTAGTSYTATAKCAIQLVTPATTQLRIVEWGINFSGSAAGTPSICTLALAGAASTMTTPHSTSTIVPISDNAKTSSLTMGTGSSGYGAGAITTNTTSKMYDAQQVAQAGMYLKQWPLGREPVVPVSSTLQLRVNTAVTLIAIAYIVFEEN